MRSEKPQNVQLQKLKDLIEDQDMQAESHWKSVRKALLRSEMDELVDRIDAAVSRLDCDTAAHELSAVAARMEIALS